MVGNEYFCNLCNGILIMRLPGVDISSLEQPVHVTMDAGIMIY